MLVLTLMGGFASPLIGTRAWMRLFIMFTVGAVSVSVVDHDVGTIDRSNLRGLYIVFGGLLMIGALVWLNTVKAVL